MAELSRELQHARRLLHGVTAAPGARERIYADIVTPRPRARHRLLSPALITASVLVASGAAAVSLGLVELPAPFRAPQTAPEAAPSPPTATKRSVGRAKRHQSEQQPARPTASTDDPEPATATFAEPEPAAPSRHVTAPSEPGTNTHGAEATAPPSELALQVKAYRRAVTLIPGEPGRALGELRAFRSQWPGSSLSHEVDLRIVQTLLTLGNRSEAQREAAAFLARYPSSPRAAEMQAIVGQVDRNNSGSR
jgi:hypothetical protein